MPAAADRTKPRGRPCPICGKPVVPEAAPFCSERCRKIDLGRWLSGSYVIPGDDSDDEADSIPGD